MREARSGPFASCLLVLCLVACAGQSRSASMQPKWNISPEHFADTRVRTIAGQRALGCERCQHVVRGVAHDGRWALVHQFVSPAGGRPREVDGGLHLITATGGSLRLAPPVDISPDGRFIATREGGLLLLIDTASRAETKLHTPAELWPGFSGAYGGRGSDAFEDNYDVPYLRFSPDGRHAAYVRDLQSIVVRELDTGRERLIDLTPRSAWSISWDPSSTWLIAETIAGGEKRRAAMPVWYTSCEDCGGSPMYGIKGRVTEAGILGPRRFPFDVQLIALHLPSFRVIPSTARELASSPHGLLLVERDGSLSRMDAQARKQTLQSAACDAVLLGIDPVRPRALYRCRSTSQDWLIDGERTLALHSTVDVHLYVPPVTVFAENRSLLSGGSRGLEAFLVDLASGDVEKLDVRVEQVWGSRAVLSSRAGGAGAWTRYLMDLDSRMCWALPEPALLLGSDDGNVRHPSDNLLHAQRYLALSPSVIDLESLQVHDLTARVPGLCHDAYGACEAPKGTAPNRGCEHYLGPNGVLDHGELHPWLTCPHHEGDCTHPIERRCGKATVSAAGDVLLNLQLTERTDALIRIDHSELGEGTPLAPLTSAPGCLASEDAGGAFGG